MGPLARKVFPVQLARSALRVRKDPRVCRERWARRDQPAPQVQPAPLDLPVPPGQGQFQPI